MEIIDGIWTSHSLIRELKGIPDGFVFAMIGEERYRIANMLGGTIEIANVTDSIRRVLELSGILKIIKITDLEEMAG